MCDGLGGHGVRGRCSAGPCCMLLIKGRVGFIICTPPPRIFLARHVVCMLEGVGLKVELS